MKQTVEQILFELFGELKEVDRYEKEIEFYSEKFKVKCLYYKTKIGVSVDIFCHRRKYQPINFVLTEKALSRRKKQRIKQALAFLLRNKEGEFWGSLPGFDDLSSHVLNNFYNNCET